MRSVCFDSECPRISFVLVLSVLVSRLQSTRRLLIIIVSRTPTNKGCDYRYPEPDQAARRLERSGLVQAPMRVNGGNPPEGYRRRSHCHMAVVNQRLTKRGDFWPVETI